MSKDYQTAALVIGASNWGEADKIVTFLTPQHGQVRAMAFGCRRPRNHTAAAMQMFNLLEVTLSPGQKLDTVRRATLARSYRRIGENLDAMAYGAFIAELVRELMPEGEPAPREFELLEQIFAALEERNPRVTAVAAAWQFLRLAGLWPSWADGQGISSAVKETINNLATLDFAGNDAVKFAKDDYMAAESMLLSYLRQVLEQPLKSLNFIRSLVK